MAARMTGALVLVGLCVLSLGWAADAAMPVYTFEGTYYEVGFQMGAKFKDQIHARFQLVDFTSMLPLLNSTTSRALVNDLLNATNTLLPQYVDEIKGMADGSGQPFDYVWLWNVRPEFWNNISIYSPDSPNPVRERCSDVLVSNPMGPHVWGHNEDSGPTDSGFLNLVDVTIHDKGDTIHFIAMQYVAILAGCAFGMTDTYAMTTNAVSPNYQNFHYLPRYIVNRHGLSAHSVAEAVMFMSVPVASGFAANFLPLNGLGTIMTVEGSADEFAVRSHPAGSVDFHFNMYMYLNISQWGDPSSYARSARANEMPTPTNWTGVANILGDTKNKDYPIYRNGGIDGLMTLFTVNYDFEQAQMIVFESNPKLGVPVATIPFIGSKK
jgi:hypothetical protein